MAEQGKGGCLKPLLIGVGVIAGLLFLASLLPDPPPRDEATTVANSAPCDEQWARGALLTIKSSTSLIRGEDATGPREGFVVMVRPRGWSELSFGQQESLAAIYDCVIAGNGSHLSHIRFRYERDGPDLAHFDSGELMALREGGRGNPPPGGEGGR